MNCNIFIGFFVWLLQHLKEHTNPIMEGILTDIENMLAQGRMDLPLGLCFAASRGDDLLMHQLLKRGLDPNELDSNGRTPLVRKPPFFSPCIRTHLSFA